MKYTYTFSVWPSESWGFQRQTFDLFRMFGPPMIQHDNVTEQEFEDFREAVNRDGITFREISRAPYHEQEPVN